ncbi:uncharacterized protein CMU_020710 [Cryptosporidium muris RN66]|uniref:Cullin family profile domain-containing protein n=1 Tax=Cryptosporidium muris (strain RN66) TaxID=441375 RepID=B6AJ90_CRYMR|nr:uncharacterized protein CMU_020710 [Cryptosporidium muris RN66]EEA08327.1 hypothetical protein CMU_020710 [Cryptosporidium muris RN66]|eukprot:XP_002142676.1 hypothetical protein [Cryptosporidium muris RN66]
MIDENQETKINKIQRDDRINSIERIRHFLKTILILDINYPSDNGNNRSPNGILLESIYRTVINICSYGGYSDLLRLLEDECNIAIANNTKLILNHDLVKKINGNIYKEKGGIEDFLNKLIGTEYDKDFKMLSKDFLDILMRVWQYHLRSMDLLCNVFLYLDCMYIRFNSRLLGISKISDIGDICFSRIINNKYPGNFDYSSCLIGIIATTISTINNYRDIFVNGSKGEIISLNQLKSFICIRNIYDLLVKLGFFIPKFTPLYKIMTGLYYKSKMNIKLKEMKFCEYIRFVDRVCQFEMNLLGCKNNNHSNTIQTLEEIDYSLINLNKVKYCLVKDEIQNSAKDIYVILINTLIPCDLIKIFEDKHVINNNFNANNSYIYKNPLCYLIDNVDTDAFSILYLTFKKVGKLNILKKEMNRALIEMGRKICNTSLDTDFNADVDIKLCLEMITLLAHLYKNVEKIWEISLCKDEDIHYSCINDSWNYIMNLDDGISQYLAHNLALFLHNSLLEYYYMDIEQKKSCTVNIQNMDISLWNTAEIEKEILCDESYISTKNKINDVILLFRFSNSKDDFEIYCRKYWMRRLLNNCIILRDDFNKKNIMMNKNNFDTNYDTVNNYINDINSQKLPILEIYFLEQLYKECGIGFIGKLNFMLKDYVTSSGLFKFFLKYKDMIDLDDDIIVKSVDSWLKCDSIGYNISDNNDENERIPVRKYRKIERNDNLTKYFESDLLNYRIHVIASSNWLIPSQYISIDKILRNNGEDSNYLISTLNKFETFYKLVYNGRNIQWSSILGIATIEVKIFDQCIKSNLGKKNLDYFKIEIITTLQQALILLNLNEKDSIIIPEEEEKLLIRHLRGLLKTSKLYLNKCRSGGTYVNDEQIKNDEILLPPILINIKDTNNSEGFKKDAIYRLNEEFTLELRNLYTNHKYEMGDFVLIYSVSQPYNCISNNLHMFENCDLNEEHDMLDKEDENKEGKDNKSLKIKNSMKSTALELKSVSLENRQHRIEAIIIRYMKFKNKENKKDIIQYVIDNLFQNSENYEPSVTIKKQVTQEIISKLDLLVQREYLQQDILDNQMYIYLP